MFDGDWPFKHQPHDSTYRAGFQDPISQMALHEMAAGLRGGKLDRSMPPKSQPTTLIDDKGRRRELDGSVIVRDEDWGDVLKIYEHKYNYEPHAQLQLASGAGLALYNLIKPDGEYEGKPLKAQAILVVHGPASRNIPPSVAELLGFTEGAGDGFFDMGPCGVLDLSRITQEELHRNPRGVAVWKAKGLLDLEDIPSEQVAPLLDAADQIRKTGPVLTSAAILDNVQRALKDEDRFRHLMSESWGSGWEGEPMTNLLEQLAEEAGNRRFAKGQVKAILGVAQARFGTVPQNLEAQLLAEQPEELDNWAKRMATAPSIEDAMKGNGSWGNGVPA